MLRAAILAALLTAPALAAPIPASDLLIRDATPQLSYRWRVAPEAATQPALLKALRSDALKELAKERQDAARDAAEAQKSGFPFRRYETIGDWTLAADTPHLLALQGLAYSFTGGAHGNTGYATRIWDKTTKRELRIDALFSDWPRARKLLEPTYCKALADEQARRRGNTPLGNDFDKCPSLAEQPIVPFGGLAKFAPQFRVLIGPYGAGPYVEGSYLITAPWPENVRPLVKPEYRADLFGAEQ
jgi:hypothetical protein